MICWYHHLLSLVGCMKILLFLLLGCLCWTMYADFSSEDIKQAAELRGKKAYDAAEKILSQYASPAYFHELNPAEKITFVQGVLELAHIYALQNRVDQALLLLSWAESLEDDYLKGEDTESPQDTEKLLRSILDNPELVTKLLAAIKS